MIDGYVGVDDYFDVVGMYVGDVVVGVFMGDKVVVFDVQFEVVLEVVEGGYVGGMGDQVDVWCDVLCVCQCFYQVEVVGLDWYQWYFQLVVQVGCVGVVGDYDIVVFVMQLLVDYVYCFFEVEVDWYDLCVVVEFGNYIVEQVGQVGDVYCLDYWQVVGVWVGQVRVWQDDGYGVVLMFWFYLCYRCFIGWK